MSIISRSKELAGRKLRAYRIRKKIKELKRFHDFIFEAGPAMGRAMTGMDREIESMTNFDQMVRSMGGGHTQTPGVRAAANRPLNPPPQSYQPPAAGTARVAANRPLSISGGPAPIGQGQPIPAAANYGPAVPPPARSSWKQGYGLGAMSPWGPTRR
jgi:hypothetical protein